MLTFSESLSMLCDEQSAVTKWATGDCNTWQVLQVCDVILPHLSYGFIRSMI